jgi:hypothetical protein
MAGAGYNNFTAASVLTASQVNTFLMDQSVMLFATSAARTTALPSPSQGMVSFLTDSGTYWHYLSAYNASTNPGGGKAAGWYPLAPGRAMFYGTCSRTAASGTTYLMGASGYTFTEITDTLAWHSTSTNTERITPNVAGLYRVIATSQTATNASGSRRIVINKNGSPVSESTFTAAATLGTNSTAAVVNMNGSSDYITASTDQSSGSSLVASGQLSVEFISPTSV